MVSVFTALLMPFSPPPLSLLLSLSLPRFPLSALVLLLSFQFSQCVSVGQWLHNRTFGAPAAESRFCFSLCSRPRPLLSASKSHCMSGRKEGVRGGGGYIMGGVRQGVVLDLALKVVGFDMLLLKRL